jgi:hypothetical protein
VKVAIQELDCVHIGGQPYKKLRLSLGANVSVTSQAELFLIGHLTFIICHLLSGASNYALLQAILYNARDASHNDK